MYCIVWIVIQRLSLVLFSFFQDHFFFVPFCFSDFHYSHLLLFSRTFPCHVCSHLTGNNRGVIPPVSSKLPTSTGHRKRNVGCRQQKWSEEVTLRYVVGKEHVHHIKMGIKTMLEGELDGGWNKLEERDVKIECCGIEVGNSWCRFPTNLVLALHRTWPLKRKKLEHCKEMDLLWSKVPLLPRHVRCLYITELILTFSLRGNY